MWGSFGQYFLIVFLIEFWSFWDHFGIVFGIRFRSFRDHVEHLFLLGDHSGTFVYGSAVCPSTLFTYSALVASAFEDVLISLKSCGILLGLCSGSFWWIPHNKKLIPRWFSLGRGTNMRSIFENMLVSGWPFFFWITPACDPKQCFFAKIMKNEPCSVMFDYVRLCSVMAWWLKTLFFIDFFDLLGVPLRRSLVFHWVFLTVNLFQYRDLRRLVLLGELCYWNSGLCFCSIVWFRY